MTNFLSVVLSLIVLSHAVTAFVTPSFYPSFVTVSSSCCSDSSTLNGLFDGFFEELDNFIDDAMSRRLGAGSAFYGKRKSSFYGDEDSGRKSDPTR